VLLNNVALMCYSWLQKKKAQEHHEPKAELNWINDDASQFLDLLQASIVIKEKNIHICLLQPLKF